MFFYKLQKVLDPGAKILNNIKALDKEKEIKFVKFYLWKLQSVNLMKIQYLCSTNA